MIAVDSSAIFAIALEEQAAARCLATLDSADAVLISAATLTKTLIVALRHQLGPEIHHMMDVLKPQIIPVDGATALRIERIYRIWGKGFHKAALNFGDCFAYDVAREHGCPLLYVGSDFAQTDVEAAV